MTESTVTVVNACKAYLSHSPEYLQTIAVQEDKQVAADQPKAKPTEALASTAMQSKSSPPITSALVPPDPDALRKGITLTQGDFDEIDDKLLKDARESKRSIFRDVIMAKRNSVGLPRLPKEEEDIEIEKMEIQYYEKTNEEKQNTLQEYDTVSIGDFRQQPIEEPKQLIKKLLYQGDEMCVGSGSKSYKTFSLIEVGLSIGSGSH